jgi:hypothetical protein
LSRICFSFSTFWPYFSWNFLISLKKSSRFLAWFFVFLA